MCCTELSWLAEFRLDLGKIMPSKKSKRMKIILSCVLIEPWKVTGKLPLPFGERYMRLSLLPGPTSGRTDEKANNLSGKMVTPVSQSGHFSAGMEVFSVTTKRCLHLSQDGVSAKCYSRVKFL